MHWLFIARSYSAVLAWDACVATYHFLICFLIYGIRKNEIKNFKCKGGFYTSVRFLVLATPRQPLTFSPHPSPGSFVLKFWPSGAWDQRNQDGAWFLILIECARILQKRSLIFQLSGLSTSGSFNCDKKKVLHFEQKGSRLCTNPSQAVNDQNDLALDGEFWSKHRYDVTV